MIEINQERYNLFKQWFYLSVKYKDCDPAVWMTNYINKRYQHNTEQKLWFCWLYGNTYHLPTAWVLMNEFPDFELATVERITKWNEVNYKRLRYQTDTKWNKGHLPAMFQSYKNWIGDKTQEEKFTSMCLMGSPLANFDRVWYDVNTNLHKFGRYSSWFYIQHLTQTCGYKLYPSSMMFSDFNGSRSHRNGMLLALGWDDLIDKKLTNDEYDNLEGWAIAFLNELQAEYPEYASDFDPFNLETVLCSFKKIFRAHEGRYIGYYLDRQADEIMQVEKDGWYGIQWNVLWQARAETLDPIMNRRTGVDKDKFKLYLDQGIIEPSNIGALGI